jgi:Ser/Thr protein kinase RdoA (MazF antagonist)
MRIADADLHQWNYLFLDQALRAIDFDDCGWGYYAYDMADAREAGLWAHRVGGAGEHCAGSPAALLRLSPAMSHDPRHS